LAEGKKTYIGSVIFSASSSFSLVSALESVS